MAKLTSGGRPQRHSTSIVFSDKTPHLLHEDHFILGRGMRGLCGQFRGIAGKVYMAKSILSDLAPIQKILEDRRGKKTTQFTDAKEELAGLLSIALTAHIGGWKAESYPLLPKSSFNVIIKKNSIDLTAFALAIRYVKDDFAYLEVTTRQIWNMCFDCGIMLGYQGDGSARRCRLKKGLSDPLKERLEKCYEEAVEMIGGYMKDRHPNQFIGKLSPNPGAVTRDNLGPCIESLRKLYTDIRHSVKNSGSARK
jgi:hypothetical protein